MSSNDASVNKVTKNGGESKRVIETMQCTVVSVMERVNVSEALKSYPFACSELPRPRPSHHNFCCL